MTGDPSTETWRQSLGLSTSAQLRQAQRETVELASLLIEAREEVTGLAETLSIFDSALRDARRSLAASQADLTRVEQERDLARAQLDDAIATFRAEKES